MFEKFQNIRDEELVLRYKEWRSDDIEMELIDRYKIHARKLAGEQYQKFKFIYLVEYEDLYSISLANLFIAIKSFSKGHSFFKYWKRSAINEIQDYVSRFDLTKDNVEDIPNSLNGDDVHCHQVLSQNHVETIDDNDLLLNLDMTIYNSKELFKGSERDILVMYLAGYSGIEIAAKLNLKYNYVNRKIKTIKTKLSNILFNQ